MGEDIKAWLKENADRVGADLLRGIGDDGIGFVIIFMHPPSKAMEVRTNIIKRPLLYLLQRAMDSIKQKPESQIIQLNVPDSKIIKA